MSVRKRRNKGIIITVAVMVIASIVILLNVGNIEVFLGGTSSKVVNIDEIVNEDTDKVEEKEDNIIKIEVAAVGDFLVHKEILETQYNSENDSYDFTNTLQYVKSYLSDADLAIGNMEGTLSGIENYGYSGYPSFNAPDTLADAIKWSGIDILANMNNHSLDRDVRGFNRTRQTLISKGFNVIGTRANTEEQRYVLKDLKGVKIGVISYGYTVTTEDGSRGLNGISIPEEVLPLMNTFNPNDIDNDLDNMKEEIEKMRRDGAEVIIFYMHWGDEYELEPNFTQKKIAQFLADQKIDIVFGTHPHSLQPIDILKSTDGTSDTVVIYSMGNFLSSQRTERIGNPYTEDGVIVSVDISKNMNTGEIIIDTPTYIPTWVNWYGKNGKLYYEVVPANIDNANYLTEEGKIRVNESLERTKSIIEKYNDSIKIKK